MGYSGLSDDPLLISADVPGQGKVNKQGEAPSPGLETDDCLSVPSSSPTDPWQYDLATRSATVQFARQPKYQKTALERHMEEIFADWERCQEDGSSDGESDDNIDINTGSPSASDEGDDPRTEFRGTVCFTAHGGMLSGASESSARNCTGSGNETGISRDSSLGQASHSSQDSGDGGGVNFSGNLIANGDVNRREKASAKILPCPIKVCPGKESSMSELL
jgi:hypothetical protein